MKTPSRSKKTPAKTVKTTVPSGTKAAKTPSKSVQTPGKTGCTLSVKTPSRMANIPLPSTQSTKMLL